tara:strand:+ start:77 stop:553 length:477 start_codon:yes stop_codon:yes gene_type:complete
MSTYVIASFKKYQALKVMFENNKKHNEEIIINIIWIIAFGFLLNGFIDSKKIILLVAVVLTYYIMKIRNMYIPEEKEYSIPNKLVPWVSQMIDSTNTDEKTRCYLEIYDHIRADSLLDKSDKTHRVLIDILDTHAPLEPVPINSANEKNYGISVSFLK